MKTTLFNRLTAGLLAAVLCLSVLAGCAAKPQKELTRYSTIFYDVFDTVTQVIAYCESEEEFTKQMEALHADLISYNQLYDIYNDYDGVVNVKTINDNAGKAPVQVDDRILSMLELARQMYDTTNGKLNVAMGSVLNIWHNYREAAESHQNEADNTLPTQEELERLKDAEVILSHLFTIPREVFEAAPKLRYILSARGGVENIDLKAAHEHGVSVIHCPAHNAIAVAEYAIGLMIAESRNIARADRGLRSGTWIEKYPDSAAIPELRGSNVGIIGFGTIGRLVAERLQVFGAKILVSDPFVPAEAVTAAGCEPVSKEELLRRSDFVTLHGRIGAGDPPIIGEQELREMKPTAVLVNTARAVLVDMEALYTALKEHWIMGAAVDVFPMEPLPKDYKLLTLDNITLTNHRGGDTINSYIKAPELLLQQFDELLTTGTTRCLIQ